MSDTQWISVNERMPDHGRCYLIERGSGDLEVAYRTPFRWEDTMRNVIIEGVTHWMDLPEPPAPHKPAADPFEAWWLAHPITSLMDLNTARDAWDAARAHYERQLPDFEVWWFGLESYLGTGIARLKGSTVTREIAQSVWNAAQGKPEA